MNCMAHAFSKALGIPFAQFIELVGHDGSAKCYKDKTFSRGFHIQECIDVCVKLGYACTEIQAYYGSTPVLGSTDVVPAYSEDVCAKRFWTYLSKTQTSVLAGRRGDNKIGHAVFWDGTYIHDSFGNYVYRLTDAYRFQFYPDTLWIVESLRL